MLTVRVTGWVVGGFVNSVKFMLIVPEVDPDDAKILTNVSNWLLRVYVAPLTTAPLTVHWLIVAVVSDFGV